MARDIVTNLIANDKASKPLKAAAAAAEDAAGSFDDLSAAEQRLALESEKARVRVEKATASLARAEQRYGKESLQAREASIKLRSAQLDLADAAQKANREVDDLGDAVERSGSRFGGLRTGVAKLTGVVGALVPGLARATAGASAFGTVALTAGPAVVGLGVHVAVATANFARLTAAAAPAAASFLPVAAGAGVLVVALKGMGPALAESVSSIGTSFTKAGDAAGVVAAHGVSNLSRSFVKLNMPGIRSNMLYIADAVNGVVLSVGKWLNSVTGQRAIATSVTNVAEAFHELAPDVSALAIAFLNLFSRTAGDTRAIDLLATGLNRAIVGATNFINGLTPAKIDAAWAAVGRLTTGFSDFVDRLKGWGGAVMGAVRWWRANAEEIQHVRDILGVVAIAVGVATGGWIPALVAGISLLVAHWDKVSGAMQAAKRWLNGTSGEATATRAVIAGLQGAVGDLSSWFTGKLLPALERAGTAILPTLRTAAKDVSGALRDNKDIVGKVQGVLSALGIVLTEAVIPALTWLFQHGVPLVTSQFSALMTVVNKVVLPGIRIFTGLVLDQFGAIINGAAAMFGWIPGLGPKLREAASKFNTFRDQVNGALSGIKDQKVTVGATIYYGDGSGTVGFKGSVVKAKRDGGPITGPGGPRDDRIPAMLSNGEFVVNARDTARHRSTLEQINAGRYANGGIVLSTSTAGIPQMMAAERKALLAAAKRMAPDFGAMGGGGGSTAGARALGKAMAAAYGWGGGQWNALERLWTGESGWNPRAKNPTSTAFGIPQFLKSTAGAYGLAYGDTNPAHQIAAGLRYIRDAYGSPASALARWSSRSPHWYANGGVINEPVMGVGLRSGDRYGFGERGPETVTPGVHRAGGGSTVTYETTINVNATGSDIELENKLVRVLNSANARGRLRQIGIT